MKNKSNRSIFLAIFTLILIAAAGSANAFAQDAKNNQCLAYEPATVSLDGKLMRKVVVNASEQKETIWIVKLDNAVCVAADADNEINPAVERVTDIQLVLNSKQFRGIRALQNQKVTVTGTLFAGHTQHHFTDVLLMVTDFKKRQ